MDWKQEIFKRLDAIGEKLGVAASHLWGVLVRQGIAVGVSDCLAAGLCFVGFVVCARIGLWAWRNGPIEADKRTGIWNGDWRAQHVVAAIAGSIGSVVLAAAFLINLQAGIIELVNPEFYALQQILNSLK